MAECCLERGFQGKALRASWFGVHDILGFVVKSVKIVDFWSRGLSLQTFVNSEVNLHEDLGQGKQHLANTGAAA
jgi:hypothetical protein